jgi:hypothetical protein
MSKESHAWSKLEARYGNDLMSAVEEEEEEAAAHHHHFLYCIERSFLQPEGSVLLQVETSPFF